MAQSLTVSSGSGIRPYRPKDGRIVSFDVEPAAAFLRGYVLTESADTDSPGGVVEGDTTDPTPIVGVAAEAAETSVAGALSKALVYVANGRSEFVAHVQDTGVPAKSNVGLECCLVKDTTNLIWRVDIGDTTNTRVKITQVLDPGDTNGRVVFRFLPAQSAIF